MTRAGGAEEVALAEIGALFGLSIWVEDGTTMRLYLSLIIQLIRDEGPMYSLIVY
jgi:hypothetical protein